MRYRYRVLRLADYVAHSALEVYYYIQVKRFWGWVTLKIIHEADPDYGKLRAEELLEKLREQ